MTPPLPPVTAVLADEHTLFRAGLVRLLQSQGIQTLAETDSGRFALELIEKHRPTLVILSLTLADPSGLEVVYALRKRHANLPVVALALVDSPLARQSAFRAGANALVSKNHDLHQLLQALHSLAQQPRAGVRLQRRQEKFISLRQLQILRALTAGHTNEQIARALNFSRSTVKAELRQMFDAFATQDRSQLISQAAHHGLIGTATLACV